jgi:membrane protein DedA with SNARE-associated domain
VIGVVAVSAPPPLPGIFASLAALLDHYGYLVVVGLVITEGFGMPAPGQTMLLAAGLYAGTGQLNIVAIGLLGFLAATAGDNIGFAIGHFGGRRLVLRFGRYVLLTEQRLDKTADVFTRHGGKIVAVARFIDGLRQVNGIIAGLVGMPWWRFLAFNALGAALWVGLWTTVGYLAGNHIGVLYDQFHHYELYLLIAAVVVTVGLIIRHLVRRRRDHRQAHH